MRTMVRIRNEAQARGAVDRTTQAAKIYGKFKPDADDYRRALALGQVQ
jgi:hypothetical protein